MMADVAPVAPSAPHRRTSVTERATYRCENCRDPFTARTADRKRGWARFCSKSCKASKQEKRTGQYRRYLNGGEGLHDHGDFDLPWEVNA
jgi:predicted SprT family Zn-dependent metalloprotease